MNYTCKHIYVHANANSGRLIQFAVSKILPLIITFLFSFVSLTYSQSIAVNTITPTTVCAGSTITVSFTATNGNGLLFKNTTPYYAYLSQPGGAASFNFIDQVTTTT